MRKIDFVAKVVELFNDEFYELNYDKTTNN